LIVPDGPSPRYAQAAFLEGSFSNDSGTRLYKLFVPSGYQGQPSPLIVMLHGCAQNPDDFAAGTRMNDIADADSCFVVYPAQSQSANQSRCWNWFNASNQQRDHGEPSLIAGIIGEVAKTYHIDQRQIFVAGMSAGGAMAVIMAASYPELFAGVGVHSAMPYKAAQNMFSALSAMRSGSARTAPVDLDKGIPIIVFHGDEDDTVHPRNGAQIVTQLLGPDAARVVPESSAVPASPDQARAHTHTLHRDADGRVLAEHWVVHGAGHAWSGGDSRGSFTDTLGPDASREMFRFFEAVGRSATSRRGFVERCLRALKIR